MPPYQRTPTNLMPDYVERAETLLHALELEACREAQREAPGG